jgi:hypothetical protein
MFFVVEFDSREVNQTVIKTPRVHITSYLFSYIYTNNAIFPIKVIIFDDYHLLSWVVYLLILLMTMELH